MIKQFQTDHLKVYIYETRMEMGKSAADDIASRIRSVLQNKESCRIIFAAAPSQNEMLSNLIAAPSIDWNRIHAFHMDEYVGLDQDAPQGFGNFLHASLFRHLPFASVNYINGNAADLKEECIRYAGLLTEHPIDIVCMGIGENGHIAFNDPDTADFNDCDVVKEVTLDETCRNQQVNDGCFSALSSVPKTALTLTIPALICADSVFCVVPAATKSRAVFRTIHDPVDTDCPASILRTHTNAVLYLDKDSAGLL